MPLESASSDLLILRFAGIVSQLCKIFLTIGSLLPVNNSRGDAGPAQMDHDFELITTVHCHRRTLIAEDYLDDYFFPKTDIRPTIEVPTRTQKRIGFKVAAGLNIFKLTTASDPNL